MITIEIDGQRVWPVPGKPIWALSGATKTDDGAIAYKYTPAEAERGHSLLVRIEPEEVRKIIRAWRFRAGVDALPANEEIMKEVERRIEERERSGKAGKS